ncbi:hypothetical protein CSB86_6930 [Pseudomonas aeruginosa]|nr:hypothetical protein CSB86_6930 [Pseudomonas aeruginosa]
MLFQNDFGIAEEDVFSTDPSLRFQYLKQSRQRNFHPPGVSIAQEGALQALQRAD